MEILRCSLYRRDFLGLIILISISWYLLYRTYYDDTIFLEYTKSAMIKCKIIYRVFGKEKNERKKKKRKENKKLLS